MTGIIGLLGDTLVKKGGDKVATSSLCGSGKVVGLYFSAHWCPPCQAFTPELAKWYNAFKNGEKGDKLEFVYVSSDKDQGQFDEYFAVMPWLAVPFSERDKKAKLSKKFKVQGIPTLIFIEADSGKLITNKGRYCVGNDPEGKEFPWYPRPIEELLKGPLKGQDGDVDEKAIEGKVKGLYFSAHWCPPCRGFTPQLIETYNTLKTAGKEFEIIFLSSDRSQESFDNYFKTMPWLALPFGDKRKDDLSDHFNVEGIPTLVILDKDNKVITSNARGAVGGDKEGKDFPWYPKPLNDLTASSVGQVNESACLIYFTPGEEKDVNEVKEKLQTPAEEYQKSESDQELHFFYARENADDDDIVQSIRDFANLPDAEELLVILDIPEQRMYVHKAGDGKITKEDITQIVADFSSEKLVMKPIRG